MWESQKFDLDLSIKFGYNKFSFSLGKKCEIKGTKLIIHYKYNFYRFDKMVISRNMYQFPLTRGLPEVRRLPSLNIDL